MEREIVLSMGLLYLHSLLILGYMEKYINFKDIKVLVVENDVLYIDLIKAYLGYIGCESDFASDGQEAIDKVKSNKYDICFMDIHMEPMGGIEATKVIRKEIDKDLPIIALTGTITDDFKENYFQVGMNDFVMKPVSKEMIEAKIIQYTKNLPVGKQDNDHIHKDTGDHL